MKKTTNYQTIIWHLGESEGVIDKPANVYAMFQNDPQVDWDTEQMWVIGMNIKNDVHLKHLVAKGGYNALGCIPADFLVPALRANLRHTILVHNHPSGDTIPSNEDITFTAKAKKACDVVGVSLLDHIIITESGGYQSLKKMGVL